jgi:23S rRNA (uracil1939-C5)-methyltransferase
MGCSRSQAGTTLINIPCGCKGKWFWWTSETKYAIFNPKQEKHAGGKKLKPGDLIELRIDSVAFGGDGVGRIQQQVVFVPFTVDGDEAAVRITDVRKRFVRGSLEQLLKPSPHRIEPRCRHYAHCGGCQYQHIHYEHQLRLKGQQVSDAFIRIAKVALPPLTPVIPSPRSFQYRGKADYHVRVVPKDAPVIGFMDIYNDRIIDIDHCEIVDETINTACLAFRRDLATGRISTPWDRQTIWSAGAAPDKTEVVTDFRKPRFVKRIVKGQNLTAPYRGFFQANEALLPHLIDEVLGLCALTGPETVVDAYCGAGLFSLFLAPGARQVYGIERDGEAIHCARVNHRQAGFANAVFLRGDAGEILHREFVDAKRRVDVLILDPPRTGCEPSLLSGIIALKPSRIVYISCNPATQARDIGILLHQGFALKSLTPFDMFPQTAHIETVALLES